MMHVVIMLMISMIMAITLRFELISGVFQLGHAAFLAVGAYTSALLVMHFGISVWLGMFFAGIAGATIAFLIGIVILRLAGLYFALASMASLMLLQGLLQNWEGLTRGARGIAGIPTLSLFSYEFVTKLPFYYTILIIFVLSAILLLRLEKSRFGMTIYSVSMNLDLARSIGVNPMRYKMLSLLVGSFIAGVTGGFFAHYTWYVDPKLCSMWSSFYYLVYCVVGGMSSIAGPILGTLLLAGLPYFLSPVRDYEGIILAVLMFAIIFLRPRGLIDFYSLIRNWSLALKDKIVRK